MSFFILGCGHCKNAKPLFTNAAATHKDNPKIAYCAIDCTKSQSLCKEYEIQGYPTIKYFSFGKFVSDYEDDRTVNYFFYKFIFQKNTTKFRKKLLLNL